MSKISSKRDGDVLVVISDNPPVNALAAEVRAGLLGAIRQAESDSRIKAIVIRGEGRTFFAGADITEFDQPLREPGLVQVIDAIEACSKPVIAAIHGTALGGGLEVALGCHYRVAIPSAKLGLPEVKLGILPGAGGTQRLPRVIGVEAALTMIVTGDPISATTAKDYGLLDRIVGEASLEAEAIAFAREIMVKHEHPIASHNAAKSEAGIFARFRSANARRLKGFEAPEVCIQAVEAATTLSFDQGMAREQELFGKLMSGQQSKALRHVFFAERAAAKIDDLPADTRLIPIRKVGVLGAGTMGGGIAMNFLSAGIPVTIVEREQPALERGVAIIRRNYDNSAQKGRMTREGVDRTMGQLTATLDYGDLADCDLVIEAVFELMEIKRSVFRELDKVCKPGAIIATNTSFLNVDKLAAETGRPESVIGLHFFSPANVMRLLEIVRGAKTAPAVLATCMALAKRVNKIAVVAGVCHGFIGNRMLEPRQVEATALLLEGAKPWDIDRVMLDFGFPMGPFQMDDLAGVDIGWDPAKSKSSTIREILCERGRRGQKTGKGYYDYDDRRNRSKSPEVEQIIADFSAQRGKQQRTIDDSEIRERLLYPIVNEGALILEERIAQRASDIDTVWLNGYGWPAWTGGPMFWSDSIGLDKIVAGLKKHASHLQNFKLSTMLSAKAAANGRFYS